MSEDSEGDEVRILMPSTATVRRKSKKYSRTNIEKIQQQPRINPHSTGVVEDQDVGIIEKILELIPFKTIIVCIFCLGFIPILCVVTCLAVAVISIFVLSSTLLHAIYSITGEAGKNKLVSPISDKAATCILLLAIILLVILMGIVQKTESWRGLIGSGLYIIQWLKIFMVVLLYYILGIFMRVTVEAYFDKPLPQWHQCLVEAVYFTLLLPMVLLLMKVVPSWKHQEIYGLLVWKWLLAMVLVVLGHHAIAVAAKLVISVFLYPKGINRWYYYVRRQRRGVTFLSVAIMHLTVWKLYFIRRITKKSLAEFGTGTFACEITLAGLWLVKNWTLHYWQAQSIYNRPDGQIIRKLNYWYCLHNLGLIKWRSNRYEDPSVSDHINTNKVESGTTETRAESLQNEGFDGWIKSALLQWYRFMRRHFFDNSQKKIEAASNKRREDKWWEARDSIRKVVLRQQQKDIIAAPTSDENATANTLSESKQKYLHYQRTTMSIEEKHRIAYVFQSCHRSLPSEKDLNDFLDYWKNQDDFNQNNRFLEEDDLREIFRTLKLQESDSDAAPKILYEQLKNINRETYNVSITDLQTWMDRARQSCLQMQYLLVSAGGIVNFLNRLMVGFIITVVVILWLLLTELLPTKTVVVIASPFLAATFIFGDVIKTVFQGIVFAYFMHPFTVGDLCIIDNTQLEVKEIGVWRTAFCKVATEEEVFIPNSALAKKAIVNCEGQPELLLPDVVEFSLDTATQKDEVIKLRDLIEGKQAPTAVAIAQEEARTTGQTETEDVTEEVLICNEIQCEDDQFNDSNIRRLASEPNTDEVQSTDHEANYTKAVVKQIQDRIQIAVHFRHRDAINDMTKAEAYRAKCKRKSDVLQRIAGLVSEHLYS